MASKDQRKEEQIKVKDKAKRVESSSDDSESEDEEGSSEKSSQEPKGIKTKVKTVASKDQRKEEQTHDSSKTLETSSDDSDSDDEKGKVVSESTDSDDSCDSGGKHDTHERRQMSSKSTLPKDGAQASKGDTANQATSNIKSDAAQVQKRKAASKKSRRSDSSSSDDDSLKSKVHSPWKVPPAAVAKTRVKTKPEDSAFSSGSDSDERASAPLHARPLSFPNKQVTPQKLKKKAAMVKNVTKVGVDDNDDEKVGNKPTGERSDNEGFRETKGVDVPATPLLSSTMKLQPNKEPETCNLSAIQTPRRKKKKSRKSVPGFS